MLAHTIPRAFHHTVWQVSEMDVRVGKKPNPLSIGTIMRLPKVFNRMFEWFHQEHPRIVTVHFESHEEDPLSCFGSLTVSQIRRWLAYYQLVTVEEVKEPLPEPDDFRKNRIMRIMKPTKRGFYAYESGLLLEVKTGYKKYVVGVGSPYTSWDEVFRVADAIWNKAKISASRQGKWYMELKKFHLENLLDKKTEEALSLIHSWASEKAWDWNTNHKRRRRGIKNIGEPPKSQTRLM